MSCASTYFTNETNHMISSLHGEKEIRLMSLNLSLVQIRLKRCNYPGVANEATLHTLQKDRTRLYISMNEDKWHLQFFLSLTRSAEGPYMKRGMII